LRESGPRVGY